MAKYTWVWKHSDPVKKAEGYIDGFIHSNEFTKSVWDENFEGPKSLVVHKYVDEGWVLYWTEEDS